jgi:hypothetical protein
VAEDGVVVRDDVGLPVIDRGPAAVPGGHTLVSLLEVPDDLPAGRYTLRVRIAGDGIDGELDSTLPFTVRTP